MSEVPIAGMGTSATSKIGAALCGQDDVADCVVELGVLGIPYYMFILMVPLRIHELYSCARSLPPRRWPFTNLVKRVCCAFLVVANAGIAAGALMFYDKIYGASYVVITPLIHAFCWVLALLLLDMEYRRYLPQSWLGLRTFWLLTGVSSFARVMLLMWMSVAIPSDLSLALFPHIQRLMQAGRMYPSSGSPAMVEHTIDSGYSPPSVGSPAAMMPPFRPCLKLLDVQVVAKLSPTGQAFTEYKLFTRVYPQVGEAFQITAKRRFKVLKWLDDRLRVMFDHDRFPEFHAKMGSFPPREAVEANPFTRQVGLREYFRNLYTCQIFMVPELLDMVGLNPMVGMKHLNAFQSLSANQLRNEEMARASMRGRGSVSLNLAASTEQQQQLPRLGSSTLTFNRSATRGSPPGSATPSGLLQAPFFLPGLEEPSSSFLGVTTKITGYVAISPGERPGSSLRRTRSELKQSTGDVPSSAIVYYDIATEIPNSEIVYFSSHRFSEFETLALRLRDFLQVRLTVSLPPKLKMPGVSKSAFLEQRREQLEHFLRGLLTDPAVCHCLLLWDFLNVPRSELNHLLDPVWGNGTADALEPGRPNPYPPSPRRFSSSLDTNRASNYATLRTGTFFGRGSVDRVSPSPLSSMAMSREASLSALFGMSAPQSMGVLPETLEEIPALGLEDASGKAELLLYHYDVDCLPEARPKALFIIRFRRMSDGGGSEENWLVQRRYAEFRELYQALHSRLAYDNRAKEILNDLKFPLKALAHRADLEKAQNEERAEMLGIWIGGVVANLEVFDCPALEDFMKRDAIEPY
ncbi:hypothetical protein FOL47_004101 [Perkinsus chesapeaki]|uniref:PX domain-containing protein n=1 Tax=Perkinsus chesapeaki TaxID=330153 RepID=A0A7J6M4C5_PERCH|nr:hypothetical protein FOL47_004101 [Perkinsus chesapeaki]